MLLTEIHFMILWSSSKINSYKCEEKKYVAKKHEYRAETDQTEMKPLGSRS